MYTSVRELRVPIQNRRVGVIVIPAYQSYIFEVVNICVVKLHACLKMTDFSVHTNHFFLTQYMNMWTVHVHVWGIVYSRGWASGLASGRAYGRAICVHSGAWFTQHPTPCSWPIFCVSLLFRKLHQFNLKTIHDGMYIYTRTWTWMCSFRKCVCKHQNYLLYVTKWWTHQMYSYVYSYVCADSCGCALYVIPGATLHDDGLNLQLHNHLQVQTYGRICVQKLVPIVRTKAER